MAPILRSYLLSATYMMDTMTHVCFCVSKDVEDPKLVVDDQGAVVCTGCGKTGQFMHTAQEVEEPKAKIRILTAKVGPRTITHNCDSEDPTARLTLLPGGLLGCTGCDMIRHL